MPPVKAPTKPKSSAKPKPKSPANLGDLSPDQVDAILRDVDVPGNVRNTVAENYNVTRYLATVRFTTDGDGVTHVSPREA